MKKFLILFLTLLVTTGTCLAHTPLGKWEKRELKVYIEENRNAYLMKKAFGSWESSTNKLFEFEYVNKEEDADIAVLFVDTCNETVEKAVGLTYPYTDMNGRFMKAKIEIAKYPEKGKLKLQNIDLAKIMKHEIGHALGLGHVDIPYSIMNPTVDKCLDITKEDIKLIKELYPQ